MNGKTLFCISLLLFFCAKTGVCQKLTLYELKSLANSSSYSSTSSLLTKKGWVFHSSKPSEDGKAATATWAYDLDFYDNEKAAAWLMLGNVNNAIEIVKYQNKSIDVLNGILASVSASGFKLLSSEIGDNEVITKYTGSSFLMDIETNGVEDDGIFVITVKRRAGFFDPDNGLKRVYYPNGVIFQEYTLTDGKICGYLKEYYEDGTLQMDQPTIEGKAHGEVKFYFEDGNLFEISTYKNDTLSGPFQQFYSDGRVARTGSFQNGEKDGLFEEYVYFDSVREVFQFFNYHHGQKNGQFKAYIVDTVIDEIRGDFEIEGNYKQGVLDGPISFTWYMDVFNNDFTPTKLPFKFMQGEYRGGKRSGNWKRSYFDQVESGEYINDQKEGDWTIQWRGRLGHDTVFREIDLIVEKYKYGLLNGATIHNCYISKVEAPCPDSNSIFSQCFIIRKVNNRSITNYFNGKKDGLYELRDSNNVIIETGNFNLDKQTGLWIYYDPQWDYKSDIQFLDGKMHGESFYYLGGELITKTLHSFGELQLLQHFSSDSNVREEHKITATSKDHKSYSSIVRYIKSDTIIVQQFLFTCDTATNYPYYGIEQVGVKDGIYSFAVGQKVLEVGNYKNNHKVGIWKYYFANASPDGVICQMDYSSVGENEQFYIERDMQLFSGQLIIKYPSGQTKEKIRLKKGLRDGKSTTYDIKGNMIEVDEFKMGVWIKGTN